ncbi:glycoside hydrolase family 5 protein [Brucella anthropi]|uniref:glycoside hydrolase family 5 protein n=1 Tax=Brucella anthropi TaxID=529 RepID=UPI00384E4AC0
MNGPRIIQISIAFVMALTVSSVVCAAEKSEFWSLQQRGGNSFNRFPPDAAYYRALHNYGASWVRLSYDKWKPEHRDFLIGDADNYSTLSRKDLAVLQKTLSAADNAGLKVVVAPLSLPFSRWSQNNNGKFDDRIWKDKSNWVAAGKFWKDLAAELRGNSVIAAYNIINEPAPEKEGELPEHASVQTMKEWYANNRGGSRDLPAFYTYVIEQIRSVDPDTPIMVDAGWYGAADAFSYWPEKLKDENVLYSFHMYEPFEATSGPNLKRKEPYRYPGQVSFSGKPEHWDKSRVNSYLDSVWNWSKAVSLAADKVVMGETGCIRTLNSCTQYLDDVLSYADDRKFHWAFYSFREDSWDAMDYELGKAKVNWRYWEAIEQDKPDPVIRSATPEFAPVLKRLESE